jgi:hypothetical protein
MSFQRRGFSFACTLIAVALFVVFTLPLYHAPLPGVQDVKDEGSDHQVFEQKATTETAISQQDGNGENGLDRLEVAWIMSFGGSVCIGRVRHCSLLQSPFSRSFDSIFHTVPLGDFVYHNKHRAGHWLYDRLQLWSRLQSVSPLASRMAGRSLSTKPPKTLAAQVYSHKNALRWLLYGLCSG